MPKVSVSSDLTQQKWEGRVLTHLASIEVEEDPYSHLCNEDEQKEHKVLGTKRYRVSYGPRDA